MTDEREPIQSDLGEPVGNQQPMDFAGPDAGDIGKTAIPQRERLSIPSVPELNIHPIGDILYVEGLVYGDLELVRVGAHTSYVVHDCLGTEDQWISIHFRENLERLRAIPSLRKKVEAFFEAIGADLSLLAKALKEDPKLSRIKIIYGLTSLSAGWGKRNGFAIQTYSEDQGLVGLHDRTIVGKTDSDSGGVKNLLFFHLKQADL